MSNDLIQKDIDKAIKWATLMHKNQKRNDGIEDYIDHPLRVMALLKNTTKDEEILIASVLHDVIEDTIAEYKDVEFNFGKRVADLVLECSKPYDTLKSKEALMIKFADMLDNVSDSPKESWIKNKCNMIRKSHR